MILCAWALCRMDFLPPCAQPDILTLCTLSHLKSLNRFPSRAANRLDEWSCALVHWQGLGNLKNYLCAAWVSQTAFSDSSEKSTWNISCIRKNFLFPFTGIQKFLRETVKSCRRDGFVQTILGRRRYLPAIKDPNPYSKAHVRWVYFLFLFFFKCKISLHLCICGFTGSMSHLGHDLPLLT